MKTTGTIIRVGSAQFERVESGLYRNITSGTYFYRPKAHGKRTWRSLETQNLKHAREELHRRLAGGSVAEMEKAKAAVLLGEIIRRYQKDGFPDRQKQPRVGRTLQMETRNCSVLLKFWDKMRASEISLVELDRYHAWRKKNATNGRGDRAVDLELNTLSNALLWGMRCNLIQHHPLSFRRPRYCCAKNVKHCRDFMPHDSEALHEIASLMFSDRRAETLGWQMMFEAFTGLRTCEALRMRTDAQPFEPGWITKDGKSLCVRRAKNQESVNPFVRVHEGLEAWLKAHAEWKQRRYPDSPWFFPNYRDPVGKRADSFALSQSLRRRRKTIGKKITSHAMRAFYVTVRRSHGIPDVQIAYEIGHTSAGKTLASVYGGVPPHWLLEDGPKLKWLPENGKPAWESINSGEPQCPAQNNAAPVECPPPSTTACNEACPEPARPATEPTGAQSCPPTPKFSGRPPVATTKYSYPETPFAHN
jgi:integrase